LAAQEKDKMKMISQILLSFVLIAAMAGTLRAEDMQDSVDQAAVILKRFKEMPEKSIPEKYCGTPAAWPF